MIVGSVLDPPEEIPATPGRRRRGWEVELAAHGHGEALLVSVGEPVTIMLGEGEPDWCSGPVAPTSGIQVRLKEDGRVLVGCTGAPPVLCCPDGRSVVPLAAPHRTSTLMVQPGGAVLACSPSLLGALSPAEVLAAPRLAAGCPAPRRLLDRWMALARDAGVPGAAAAVARYRPGC